MNNGTRLGLSNIQFSTDGVDWKPLGIAQEVDLKCEQQDNEFYDFVKDINKPIEISCSLYKKKNGCFIEKCLYYIGNKKKRIRKKYNDKLYRLLKGENKDE